MHAYIHPLGQIIEKKEMNKNLVVYNYVIYNVLISSVQVSSASATFGMTFSSSMSVVEYYLLKRFPVPYGNSVPYTQHPHNSLQLCFLILFDQLTSSQGKGSLIHLNLSVVIICNFCGSSLLHCRGYYCSLSRAAYCEKVDHFIWKGISNHLYSCLHYIY